MNGTPPIVIAVGLILGGQLAFAQDWSRYRADVLESNLDSESRRVACPHFDLDRMPAAPRLDVLQAPLPENSPMASSFSRSHATAVLLDDDQNSLPSATCPICYTSAAESRRALEAAGDWCCVRCRQHWDAARLALVAAYLAWTVDRDRIGRQVTEGSPGAELHGDSPTEQPGGRP